MTNSMTNSMTMQFSEDDRLIQDQVEKYLSQHGDIKEVRRVLDGETPYSDALWQGLSDMGVTGMSVPEEYGGSQTGYKSLCLVAFGLMPALRRGG